MLLRRLNEYMQYRNLSFNKLELSLGASHGSISNAMKNNKNIGSNVIENILDNYAEISAEWLLRGKGEMLVNSNSMISIHQDENLSNKLNEILIRQTLNFLNLESRAELQLLLSETSKKSESKSLEDVIISTWEKKYGQELKSIKHQVMTLFTAKLDSEKRPIDDNKSSNSKIG
jgi:hypothetical protein